MLVSLSQLAWEVPRLCQAVCGNSFHPANLTHIPESSLFPLSCCVYSGLFAYLFAEMLWELFVANCRTMYLLKETMKGFGRLPRWELFGLL